MAVFFHLRKKQQGMMMASCNLSTQETEAGGVQIEGQPGGRRTVEGVNSSMIYLIHGKKFCKSHNVPPRSTKKKKKKKRAAWVT
jgi:hypothetical protein